MRNTLNKADFFANLKDGAGTASIKAAPAPVFDRPKNLLRSRSKIGGSGVATLLIRLEIN